MDIRISAYQKSLAQKIKPVDMDRLSDKQLRQREELENERRAHEKRINEQKKARQKRYNDRNEQKEAKQKRYDDIKEQKREIKRIRKQEDARRNGIINMANHCKEITLKALKGFQDIKVKVKEKDNDIQNMIQLGIPEALAKAKPEEVESLKAILDEDIKNIEQKLMNANNKRKNQINVGICNKEAISNYCKDIDKEIKNLNAIEVEGDYGTYNRLIIQSAKKRIEHYNAREKVYIDYNNIQKEALKSLRDREKKLKIEAEVKARDGHIEGLAADLRAELKNA